MTTFEKIVKILEQMNERQLKLVLSFIKTLK